MQFCLFSSSLGILDLLSVTRPNSGTYSGDTSGKISCIFQSLMCLKNKSFYHIYNLILGLCQYIVIECRNLDHTALCHQLGLCILGTQVLSFSFNLSGSALVICMSLFCHIFKCSSTRLFLFSCILTL